MGGHLGEWDGVVKVLDIIPRCRRDDIQDSAAREPAPSVE